jgi:hypothetical protein
MRRRRKSRKSVSSKKGSKLRKLSELENQRQNEFVERTLRQRRWPRRKLRPLQKLIRHRLIHDHKVDGQILVRQVLTELNHRRLSSQLAESRLSKIDPLKYQVHHPFNRLHPTQPLPSGSILRCPCPSPRSEEYLSLRGRTSKHLSNLQTRSYLKNEEHLTLLVRRLTQLAPQYCHPRYHHHLLLKRIPKLLVSFHSLKNLFRLTVIRNPSSWKAIKLTYCTAT